MVPCRCGGPPPALALRLPLQALAVWQKPSDLYGRDREWETLCDFVSDPCPGARLAVVRGHRRHGKSILLRRLSAASGGFYHQAIEGTQSEQLQDLAHAITRFAKLPDVPSFPTWRQALNALLVLSGTDEPLAIVLDEFPLLVASAPELPTLLHDAVEERRTRGPRSRILVCGSSLSVMASMLTYAARPDSESRTDLIIDPFTCGDTTRFMGLQDRPDVAIKVHAVCGGVPGHYTDLLAEDLPRDGSDFNEWMVRGPLCVNRPLLHEAARLLDSEPHLGDRALCLSILAAITDGENTTERIGRRLARSLQGIAEPLSLLAHLRIVERRTDPLRVHPPSWHIRDPLLRFYAAVLRRDWARLEQGLADRVWHDAQDAWRNRILGPHVHDLARAWIARYAEALTGRPLRTIGPTEIIDRAGGKTYRIDLAGVRTEEGRDHVAVVGEARSWDRPVSMSELERLSRIRHLLARQEHALPHARLVLFGFSGFTAELLQNADPADVILVDPHALAAS